MPTPTMLLAPVQSARVLAALLLLAPGAVLVACSDPPASQPPPELKVIGVDVLPGDVEVLTRATGGDGVQLSAVVTYDDGEVVETTDLVEWASSNESAGVVDASGWFEPSTANGGITWVSARLAGVEGQVTVTVRYQDERVEDGADPSLFDGIGSPATVDNWLYPEDGVTLPRNTPSIEFQWAEASVDAGDTGSSGDTGSADTGSSGDTGATSDPGAMTWRLRFRSELTDVLVYTPNLSWTADEETWLAIASTNAGGSVQVELTGSDGDNAVQAPTMDVGVNRFDAKGSIVYWSTSASGFMQVPYGEAASPYLTYDQTGHCMGCHSISRDGFIAYTFAGGNGQLGVTDMSDGSYVIGYKEGSNANFKTWNPDGSRLISTYEGGLTLWDTATWTSLGEIPVDGTATHVDWSPDGTQVVMVLTTVHSWDWSFTGGRIAVMAAFDDDTFGPPEVIYEDPDGRNAYYPAFSPDGDWVAFNISTLDSYDDPDAELYAIPSGGGTAVRLDAANQTEQLTNSWPRWGPLPDDDILWLAFSSKRLYGTRTTGKPQIWVTGFDPAVAEVGGDPSYPAFWLPNQDVAQSNHIPVWIE